MANPSMKLALKRLIDTNNPSVFFLQEFMTEGAKIVQYLSKHIKGWDFSFMDALGHFGGLAIGYKTNVLTLSNS
jgi:hypothetical protein